MPLWRLATGPLLTAVLLGCTTLSGSTLATPTPTPPPSCTCTQPPWTLPTPTGGMNEADARQRLLQLAPPSTGTPQVVWLVAEPYASSSDRRTVAPDTYIWVGLLSGDFAATTCPPGATTQVACGPASSTIRIIFDFYSGRFIESSPD